MPNIFNILVVSLFALAAIVSAWKGEANQAIYSASAAILNFVVYFHPFR